MHYTIFYRCQNNQRTTQLPTSDDTKPLQFDFSSHVWELTWKFSLYILRSHCDNNREILGTCPYVPGLIRDWSNKELCLCTASVSLSVKSEWTGYVILYDCIKKPLRMERFIWTGPLRLIITVACDERNSSKSQRCAAFSHQLSSENTKFGPSWCRTKNDMWQHWIVAT